MPITSYLAHPHSGRKQRLIEALKALPNCDVVPAENENLLIAITETDNQEQDDKLKQTIENLESLKLLAMVSAIVRSFTAFKIEDKTIKKIAMVVTVAAQINLILLISELFKEFYAPTHHSESACYLFFGLHGKDALLPWIWTAIPLNVLATVLLTFHKLRNNFKVLFFSCFILFVAIWIEKGFGLIVPGFIPGP
ncbi:hypothetical protein ABI125_11380 [Tamlana crocina]